MLLSHPAQLPVWRRGPVWGTPGLSLPMGAHPTPPVHGPLAPGIHIFRFLPLLLGTQFYVSLGRFCVPQAFPPAQDTLSSALFSLIEVYFIYSVSGLPQSDSFYMYSFSDSFPL